MPEVPGFPSPTTVLFNRPIRDLMLRIGRTLINFDYNNKYHNALNIHQNKLRTMKLSKNLL